jgi:uncharacterized protein YegL
MYGRPIEKQEVKVVETSVYLALDVSGSMSGDPMTDAQKAMCSFVDNMDMSVTRIGIIAVSDRSEVVLDLCSDAGKCKKAINSMTCGQTGICNNAHPFDDIITLQREKGRRFAIILADGMWSDQNIAVSAAKRCHAAEIEIAAIGFGTADSQFLKDISSSDANALKVSQSEFIQTFGKIAQSMGNSGGKGSGKDALIDTNTETWEEASLDD